jgi:transposase-like protein
MGKHKHYDAKLKTQIVLEVLKGQKSLAQICREHEVSADLVCHWRDVFLERASQVFTDPRAAARQSQEQERIAELERMVGRLTMELDASKKALQLLPSRRSTDAKSSSS